MDTIFLWTDFRPGAIAAAERRSSVGEGIHHGEQVINDRNISLGDCRVEGCMPILVAGWSVTPRND